MMFNKQKSRILLFYSPQGGAGKSTLAVNTAIFSSLSGQRTLLVDMSVYGSILSMLRIPLKGGIGLAPLITMLQLDGNSALSSTFVDIVQSALVRETINGKLDVLLSATPVKMESLKEAETKVIIETLSQLNYDWVVIDTSAELSEKNMVLLEAADGVIIPLLQDISCGWKLLLFKEVMDSYLPNVDKFRLVVNKGSQYAGFNNSEFEVELGYKLLGEIPYFHHEFQNAINKGELIHTMRNKKAFEAFRNVAKSILSEGWGQDERGEDYQVETARIN